MSGTQVSPQQPALRRSRRWRRSTAWLVAAVIAVTALVLLGLVRDLGGSDQSSAATPVTLTAVAGSGVTASQLLRLEARIVGAQAVGDPAAGRLPDVSAYHAVGVASIRIDNGVLTVKLLTDASADQRARVRSLLESSPLLRSVKESSG